jgi:hypothetical protein
MVTDRQDPGMILFCPVSYHRRIGYPFQEKLLLLGIMRGEARENSLPFTQLKHIKTIHGKNCA